MKNGRIDDPERVLEFLYDRLESFTSLAELATAADIERSHLPQILQTLQDRGYHLEHSPAHGIRLLSPVVLNAHLIERALATRRIGRHAICFGEVDSTNDIAFDSARQPNADGLVVLAKSQRKGRGRFGRTWLSPPGTNILLSVLLIDPQCRLPHDALTIAAGLAVAEAMETACSLTTELKWPNDVLLEGQKAAGILVELRNVNASRAVVVGIGINVNAAPPAEMLDAPATHLAEHLHHAVERIVLIRAVLQRLDIWVDRITAGQCEPLHEAWLARCGMLNQRLTVECAGQRYVGRVLDVSPLEGLILACDAGQQIHLPAENATIVA